MTDYADPSEWPFLSGQSHWTPHGAPVDVSSELAMHTHVECAAPLYGEVNEPITITGQIVAHHVAGVVGLVYGQLIGNFIWTDTGTATPPVMKGDPAGDKTWAFTAVLDPTIPLIGADGHIDTLRSAPLHGWWQAALRARTYFDNGDLAQTDLWLSFFSTKDVSAPERGARAGGRVINAQAGINSPQSDTPGGSSPFGTAVAEYQDYLPVLPIQAAWQVPGFIYNYSADEHLPLGTFEQRFDLDFHHDIPGHIVRAQPVDGNRSFNTFPITFDPGVMGTGVHRTALIWTQPRAPQQLSALLVIRVPVGPGIPQPTTCGDPTALNFGGPLPCVFPPPGMTPTTLTLPLGVLPPPGTYRLCDALRCVDLIVK